MKRFSNPLLLALTTSLLTAASALPEVVVKVSGEQPTTTIEGTAPIASQGIDALKNAIAEFHGNSVDITIPGQDASGAVEVMSAVILKPVLTSLELSGYLVITKTTASLTKIDDPDIEELIEVAGGGTISGHITQISDEAVTIDNKPVPLNKISRICSPRIFAFSCPLSGGKDKLEDGFEARACELDFQHTTQLVTAASGEKKRCCKFPPLLVPPIKPKGGHHHIHIIVPI